MTEADFNKQGEDAKGSKITRNIALSVVKGKRPQQLKKSEEAIGEARKGCERLKEIARVEKGLMDGLTRGKSVGIFKGNA
ncbi:hypothetical protein DdX_07183 [Ditylenchus destructor]|uniref:Uncharacterized protein n=1 Tax=Ditylenchus destructor TaxID=166010 RepID=A0AAD4R8Q8_9BILA|nr:hypothetical protein DdX_07183 [Ditylenchus destructor]